MILRRAIIVAAFASSPVLAKADEAPKVDAKAADTAEARRLAAQLQAKLNLSPEQSAALARESAALALAEAMYGGPIAVLKARERRLEREQIELRKRADDCREERAKRRAQLDKDIEQLRQQFRDDPTECERQLTHLMNAEAPRLLEQKDDAKRFADLAEKTGAKLAGYRRERLALEQQQRLAVQSPATKAPRVLRAEVELDDGPPKVRIAAPTPKTPVRSVEDRLKEIDK